MRIKFLITATILFAAIGSLNAQGLKVSGTVKDTKGETLPGVAVYVAGTYTGTSTDANGYYELNGVAANATLQAEMLGFVTVAVPVNNKSVIDFILTEDSVALNEIVVVGYGQMKKSDLTGSVASVKADKLTDVPAKSIDGLLQGRVAGLQVINASQDPGAGSTIRIRGNSSLNGSNAPLVVIDGFPYGDAGDISQINPQDIVSMEILKDASASAIYGSRGANGVIIITTKKANKNTTKITVRQQTTISQKTSELNIWRDPILMASLSNESYLNSGLTPLYVGKTNANGVYYPSLEELRTTWKTNTAWDKLVLRDAPVSNNTTVQLQSSNETTVFMASANYFSENGIYIKDNYTKFGGNFSVEHKVFDNFKMKASANIVKSRRNNNNGLSYSRNPIFPVYDENGNYWQYSASDYYHPLALTNLRKNTTDGFTAISFVSASWDILDCLNLSAQLNYKHGESISDVYSPKKYAEKGTFNNGWGQISNGRDDNLVVESYATFDKTFNNKHHLTAMLGYSYENYTGRSSSLAAKDFVNESLGNENLAAGNPESYEISNGLTHSELVSGMARINYTYDNRYLLTFTARADGSSKFGVDNKWAFFPSGAISWKINEESWMEDIQWIDLLKVRASYGISGNQGISAYQTLSRYGQHKFFHNGAWVTAIGPGYKSGTTGQDGIYAVWSGIPNAALKWETTSQANIGIDFSIFKNRLNVTLDIYQKDTKDLLRTRNIAPSSGYDKMWVNDGEIRNRGIELTLDGVVYENRDWHIGSTLIFSMNRNQVMDLGKQFESGLNKDVATGMLYENYGNQSEQFRGFTNILAIGQPMYVFYGYRTNGIIQSLAEGMSAGLTGADAEAGEFKYLDLYNGDKLSVVNEDDRVIIGDPNPDFTASLALNASWKNLDFSIFFNGVFGNDVVNTQRFNQPNHQPLRWTPDNRTDNYPRLNQNRQTKFSDWWIEDGSFVRIQNLSIGYRIPLKKTMASKNIRLYLSVDNLHTFTKFSGYDPEVNMQGVYSGGYPRLRKWTFGVDFNF